MYPLVSGENTHVACRAAVQCMGVFFGLAAGDESKFHLLGRQEEREMIHAPP
ncbi:MAG: hypothetical protein ACLFVT_03540 [Syntrophobacteria bacterium]